MPESTVTTEPTTTAEGANPVSAPPALLESILPRLEIRQSFKGEYTAACPFCRVGELYVYVSPQAGFLCLNEHCKRTGSLEKLAYMLEALPRTDEVGQDAADLGWPEPPDKEAFYGLAGDFVRTIEPHSEADPVGLLGSFLVAFGNLVGRRAHAVAERDRHHTNLFVALVGETSKARKGSSWGQVRFGFETMDPEWSERILSGLSTGEGLIWQVRDAVERDEPLRVKGKVTGRQQVMVDAGIEDKRLLVVESELASALKVISREGNTLSAVIRDAWDRGELRTLTKNSPARATGAHISILAHITREELRRYLQATEAANGFANRFLWLCVRRSKVLPEGGRLREVDFSSTSPSSALRCASLARRPARSSATRRRGASGRTSTRTSPRAGRDSSAR